MKLSQPQHSKVKLHILSPIHIGTDQELDPFSYVIRNNTLFLIDIVRWIESHPDQEFIQKRMDSDNFAVVRSFIAENFNDESAVVNAMAVDNPKLIRDYNRVIQEKDSKNQLLVSPTMRNELSGEAYIPGSSIKGAIRTAIANHFVPKVHITSSDARPRRDKGRFSPDYNEKIFGRINNDPMRYLKISDVTMGKNGTVIVEPVELKQDENKIPTPKGHAEAIMSLCHTGEKRIFPLHLSFAPFKLHDTEVDLRFIVDALYDFYVPKYEAEYSKFYKGNADIEAAIALMNRTVADLKSNETIVRVGHYSHVECVTLDNVRKPQTRKGRDGLPCGTTRTLANALYPFGWGKLEFLDLPDKPRPDRQWPFSTDAQVGDADKKSITVNAFAPMVMETKSELSVFKPKPESIKKPENEVWPDILLTYNPGNGVAIGKSGDGKTADIKGKASIEQVVPAKYQEPLFDKRKKKVQVKSITVEWVGGKNYKILFVE